VTSADALVPAFLPDVRWSDEPYRLLICDDHALFRRGLMVVVEEVSDIEVLGEADSGPEATALAEDLAPDVILVDIALPPYGGVAAAAQMSRAVPTARIIVLAANEKHPDELLEAFGAGACGVLLKELALDQVADAVRRLAWGETLLSPVVAGAVRDLITSLPDDPMPGVPHIDVSDRERLVLEVVARGADASDAATGLGISPHVAVNLLRNLVRKLQRYWRAEDAIVSLALVAQPANDLDAVAARAARVVGT
jgi:two-component system NarL family response regulator